MVIKIKNLLGKISIFVMLPINRWINFENLHFKNTVHNFFII